MSDSLCELNVEQVYTMFRAVQMCQRASTVSRNACRSV